MDGEGVRRRRPKDRTQDVSGTTWTTRIKTSRPTVSRSGNATTDSNLVTRQGFEPQLPGPEPGVLPLDDRVPATGRTLTFDRSVYAAA